MSVGTEHLSPLGCVYHWEKTRPDVVHFTQPLGGGKVAEYTWAQCVDQARRIAAYLKSLDLPARSNIAILGKNSAHWIMADWAIWMAGHVTVPLYPTLAADTVRYILEHSEARLLFVGKLDDWEAMKSGVPGALPIIRLPLSPHMDVQVPRAQDAQERPPHMDVQVPRAQDAQERPPHMAGLSWDDLVARTAPLQGTPDRDLEEMATIVYTSGSTGQPKGVMQSFRSFQVCVAGMADIVSASPSDRMLSYLPLAHVAERMVVENNSTYHGFHVFFAESLATFVQDLRRARPTIFFSVPRLWTKFQLAVFEKLPRRKQDVLFRVPFLGRRVKRKILEQLGLENVRVALTGAAPLPPPTIAWYRSLGLELLEAFGMTENMAYSHFTRPGQARIGYVGHCNNGVECRIDPQTHEVLVKSPGQMMGYYKEPAKTAECYTADGFFRTGDMGEIDDQGRLRITGRVKELFKTSKGKYVAPVPIENKLGSHPRIECVCVGGANQQATFALMLLSEDTRKAIAAEEVRKHVGDELARLLDEINATLDPHEQMEFAVVVRQPWTIDNGMLTPTMKIKRNVIEKKYEPHLGRWYGAGQKVIWE